MTVFYDPWLVSLSIVVAIVGSWTALAIASAVNWTSARQLDQVYGLLNSAIVMGSTIWSMHFVAMMAVQFPVLVNYSLVENAASLVLAVCVTGFGLYVVSGYRLGHWSIPVAGLFMGLGVGGMHYLGMAAIRGCGISYDWAGVLLSVIIAIQASAAALWFTFYRRGVLKSFAGGAVMGLAIGAMHYTGMHATTFLSLTETTLLSEPLLTQEELAHIIASAIVFVCVVHWSIISYSWLRRYLAVD